MSKFCSICDVFWTEDCIDEVHNEYWKRRFEHEIEQLEEEIEELREKLKQYK